MRISLDNLKEHAVEYLFSCCVFTILLASIALPIIRYISYLLPFGALLILLAIRRVYISEQIYVFILMLMSGLILLPLANVEGIKDLYLIFVGVSVTLVGFKLPLGWWALFIANFIGTIIFTTYFHGLDVLRFSLLSSTGVTESTFSFIFGLLAISAALQNKWIKFIISSIATIVTLKRIAVLGIIFCTIVLLLPRKFSDKFLRPVPMLITNTILLILIIGFTKGLYDSFIHDITGMSPNAFTMGRRFLYYKPVMELIKDPIRFLFIGIGPGGTYQNIQWVAKSNLHNDLLKIIVEFGGIVFITAIVFLYKPRLFEHRLFGLYTNILFLSDNVLIYPFYIYFLWLISENTNHKTEEHEDLRIAATHHLSTYDRPKIGRVQHTTY